MIELPTTFSEKEIKFIEEWYSEAGIRQLKQADRKEFTEIDEEPPVEGCRFVQVEGIQVATFVRDRNTLQLREQKQLKVVKLLILNAWAKL